LAAFALQIQKDWAYILGGLSRVIILMALYTIEDT
jgi:hypothetical protein